MSTREHDLEKKKCTRLSDHCPSQADKENAQKSTVCAKDSPDYDEIEEGSERKEEGRKRRGLCDRAAKKILALSQKRHSDGPRNHSVRKWSD